MPFIRFARDKRGVETTALLRTARGRGRSKPRLLYWFRTPPDIHLGRAAIDDAAIAALEQAHPEVTFDWPQILHASRSLAAASARRARDERAGQTSPRRNRRGAEAQPKEAQQAARAAPAFGEPAREDSAATSQPPKQGRRSRRGGGRHRRKGGGATPPGTDQ